MDIFNLDGIFPNLFESVDVTENNTNSNVGNINDENENNNNTPTSEPSQPNQITSALASSDPSQENISTDEDFQSQLKDESDIFDKLEMSYDEYANSGVGVDNDENYLRIPFPDYGYDRYVTDIANWQKQRTTLGSDPGYFYFKVFFNFNTNYGLLGGMFKTTKSKTAMNDAENTEYNSSNSTQLLNSTNTAFGYLSTLINSYKVDMIPDRIIALSKFATTLRDVSLRTPWLIKSISGLNTVNSVYTKDFEKERSITLGFNEELTDARLGTMIDLYKLACFDQMNCKEIIPANLRKFEMSIMIYSMPLKYYHTKALVSKDTAMKHTTSNFFKGLAGIGEDLEFDGILDAKTTTIGAGESENFGDLMSFKLFTFLGCEIDTEALNEYYVDGFSNENAFKLGSNSMKIRYERVYEHRMNEWLEIMFGSDGFQFNNTIPENIYSSNYLTKYTSAQDYLFNSTDNSNSSAISQYRQRAVALRNRWYGKKSIVDYTDMLIGRYYRPNNFHVPGTSLKDLHNNIVGIPDKWNKMKDNIANNYDNFIDRIKSVGNSISGFFGGNPL